MLLFAYFLELFSMLRAIDLEKALLRLPILFLVHNEIRHALKRLVQAIDVHHYLSGKHNNENVSLCEEVLLAELVFDVEALKLGSLRIKVREADHL